jgi:phospholipid-binding lipoprotein MlaA
MALGLLLLAGCASGPGATARDPFEPMNRGITKFNDALDAAVLKPAATAYQAVTPPVIRTGVSNFFNNLSDIWSTFNTVAQLKPRESVDNFLRVVVNSTFGLLGVIDVASDMNIERHPEDFGQTLGRWGVPSGPYLVLPVFGPSTLRDAAAFGVETHWDIVYNIKDVPTRNSLTVLRTLETRANLLRAGNVLDEAALDKYTFLRDVYLQKRRSDIFDGNPPEEDDSTPDTTPPDPSKPDAGGKPDAGKPGAATVPAKSASAPQAAATPAAKPASEANKP